MKTDRMMRLRRRVYELGFRPKPGNPLYSPSLSSTYSCMDARKKYDWDIAHIKEVD